MASIYKEDCKWYDYWQDMGARIPFCKAGKNMDASGFFLKTCDECKDYGNKNVTTNADRIRSMTDEELAEWINQHDCHTNLYGYDPKDAILGWLKEEADDG